MSISLGHWIVVSNVDKFDLATNQFILLASVY